MSCDERRYEHSYLLSLSLSLTHTHTHTLALPKKQSKVSFLLYHEHK